MGMLAVWLRQTAQDSRCGAARGRQTIGWRIRAAMLGAVAGLVLGCSGPSAPARPAGDGPALWTAVDADSRIWLLGTVHVLPKDVAWRSAAIDAAMAQADVLILEVPPSLAADMDFARAYEAAGRNPDGVTLSSQLTPADRAALTAAAAKAGVAVADLEGYRPWRAAIGLSYAALAKQGAKASEGVETVLTRLAAERALPVEGLETGADQIRFMQSLSPATSLAALRQTFKDIDTGDTVTAMIDTLWSQGRHEALGERLLADFRGVSDEFYRVLIADRNARWADAIAARMAGAGDVFIAVGAAHMAGPDGVPALLRARGITVRDP